MDMIFSLYGLVLYQCVEKCVAEPARAGNRLVMTAVGCFLQSSA
jgi:hypothetical protein